MLSNENTKILSREGKQILDAIDAQIFVVDCKGIVLMINKSVEKMAQTNADEIVGKSLYDLFNHDDAEKYFADNQEVISTGNPKENIIEQLQLPCGKKWVRTNKSPLYDDTGTIIGVIGTAIDITNEKIAQDELLEQTKLIKEIVQTTTDGIFVLDTNFQITFWNKSMETITGKKCKDVIGTQKKVWELFPFLEQNGVKALIEKAMNGEIVQQNAIPYRLKNGKQGFSSEIYIPLTNRNDEIKGVVGVIRETTQEEQLHAEQKLLAETANQLVTINSDEIFDLLASVIKQFSGKSIVAVNKISEDGSVNIQKIIGIKQRTLTIINTFMGKRNLTATFEGITTVAKEGLFSGHLKKIKGGLYETFFGNVPKPICQSIEKLLGITSLYSIGLRRNDKLYGSVTLALREDETTLRKEPIETIVNQVSIVLERNESYRSLDVLNKTLEDKVKNRTEEIQHLLNQKDAFIHQLGHDLKTPLGPLVNLLPIIRKNTVNEKQKHMLTVMQRNVSYMRLLVDKTLKLAQLNSSSFELSFEQINLKKIITESVDRNKSSLNSKHIDLTITCNKDLTIIGDSVWLSEVMDNLISNAIKFSKENGSIRIYTMIKENKLYCYVQDNGIGIQTNHLHHLFDEYFKVDPARHDFSSSGLGLSICKKIIEQHEGSIWAESSGLDKGARICFTLPITND